MNRAALLLLLVACGPPGSGKAVDTAGSTPPVPVEPTVPTGPVKPEDRDGDGYVEGGDCDDNDPTRHPQAVDTPYDGVDSDCLGNDDYDVDGDGSKAIAYGGSDCLDTDPSVHAGATRVCGNDIDDDCDGEQDCLFGELYLEDVADATLTVAQFAEVGAVDVGDVNGDGAADIVLGQGNDGQAYVFLGPLLGVQDEAAVEAKLPGSQGGMGFGDFDGDGLDDLAVTEQGLAIQASTTLWSGPEIGRGEPVATLLHDVGDGQAIQTTTADVNGDGFDELILGGMFNCQLEGYEDIDQGCAAIFYGPFAADIIPSDVGAVLVGDQADGSAYPGAARMDGRSDLDGDGLVDLVVVDPSVGDRGAVYVVPTPVPALVYLVEEPIRLEPEQAAGISDFLNAGCAGDVDADGHADLVVGTLGQGSRAGVAWVFRGPLTGILVPEDAFATIEDVNVLDGALPGDLDGDDSADLVLVTTWRDPITDVDSYRPEVFYAPSGAVSADAIITSPDPYVGFYQTRGLGDVDADGLADFVVAGPGLRDPTGVNAGGAVTILGQQGL